MSALILASLLAVAAAARAAQELHAFNVPPSDPATPFARSAFKREFRFSRGR